MRNGKIVSSWTQELARPGSLLAGNWGGPSKRLRNIYMQGLEETGIDDTDFQILEALLNKGPSPVNTIGPKVYLTPGSISEHRRVRIVSLAPKGKELITPVLRKHAAEIRKVFADAGPKESSRF
jgi:DNA-binding MarR family transcriptional regulator